MTTCNTFCAIKHILTNLGTVPPLAVWRRVSHFFHTFVQVNFKLSQIMTPEQLSEVKKMMTGKLYNANFSEPLIELLNACHDKCRDYNELRSTDVAERDKAIKNLLGRTGKRCIVIQPFFCDFGFNIEVGENFFANTNLLILDEGKVTFGDNVFIAPNCSFYTAGHPIDSELRNQGLEYSLPITVGSDVWICGNVTVVPGVTIGSNTVIGAGSVVTHDIPSGVVAAGNPCRVIRPITEADKLQYR